MNRKIKIDVPALEEQRREEIKKSDMYLEISIVVPKVDDISKDIHPVVQVIGRHVNDYTEFAIIEVLKSVIESIKRRIDGYELLDRFYRLTTNAIGEFSSESKGENDE